MPVIWNNGRSGAKASAKKNEPEAKKAPAEMTVKELKAELDALGVGYIASAKKVELVVMLEDELTAREKKEN